MEIGRANLFLRSGHAGALFHRLLVNTLARGEDPAVQIDNRADLQSFQIFRGRRKLQARCLKSVAAGSHSTVSRLE